MTILIGWKNSRVHNNESYKYNYSGLEAGYYDFRKQSLRKRWHDFKFKLASSVVLANSPNVIVDLGCGPGVFLRDFVPETIYRIGFDISIAQVDYANQFSSSTLVFTNSLDEVKQLLQASGLQQVNLSIVAIELIEHIDDDVLGEFHQLFQDWSKDIPNTNINWIFTTPNKNSFWPVLERLVDLIFGTDYHEQHQFLCSHKSLRKRLQRVFGQNFKIGSFMPLSSWLLGKRRLNTYYTFLFRGLLLVASSK